MYLTNKNGEEELRIHSQTENWDRLIVAIRTFGRDAVMSFAPVASPDGQRVAFDVYGAARLDLDLAGGRRCANQGDPEGETEQSSGVVARRSVDRLQPRRTRRAGPRDHPRRDTRSAANAGTPHLPASFPRGRRMVSGSRTRRTTPCGSSARMVRASVSSPRAD